LVWNKEELPDQYWRKDKCYENDTETAVREFRGQVDSVRGVGGTQGFNPDTLKERLFVSLPIKDVPT
jgi:hypothetical protein